MDLEKELEDLRVACEMQVQNSSSLENNKEIVIRHLEDCKKFRGIDGISVKDAADFVDSTLESLPSLPATTATTTVNLNMDQNNSATKTFIQEEGGPSQGPLTTTTTTATEFSKELEIPNVSIKVYDCVMSKDKTLPNKKSFDTEALSRLRGNWVWIGALGISTLLLVIIVVLFLVFFEGTA